jgi:NAD(P)-dependent dehydrogenase (short-subunit alcohol dehydrogenase family)
MNVEAVKASGGIMPKANEHVVVIGGTSGIGLALARAAHALGCKLTIGGRGAERAAEIAKLIGPGVTGLHVDLDDPASIRAALAEGPAIDHLVLVPIDQLATSVKNFDVRTANKAVHVKLTGYIELVHTVLPRLKPTSSIVLFSGLAKARPYPNATIISVVNAGIIGMMRTMAVELAPIRVNAISPSLVPDSPKWEAARKGTGAYAGAGAFIDALAKQAPSRRLPTVSDVIHGVFFLVDNPGMNGHDLEIDSGLQLV